MIDDMESFSSRDPGGLSLYHEDKVIIRMRPAPRPVMSALAAVLDGGVGTGSPEPAGTSVLSTLQRAGLIRRVRPVAVEAGHRGPFHGPQAAFTAPSASLEMPDVGSNPGFNVVELQQGTDISHIQLAPANDPLVEYVGRNQCSTHN